MSHSSTNMDPPKPKKPLKRKNQLRISQPIHHHENINTSSNTDNHIHSYSSDSLHTPQRKKPRHSSPHMTSRSPMNKIPKKHQKKTPNKHKSKYIKNASAPIDFKSYRPTHIYSCKLPLESETEILQSSKQNTLINFSCVSYDSLIEYCKMFKLHDFKYNYHYELSHKMNLNHRMDIPIFDNKIPIENERENNNTNNNKNQHMSARMSKREMDDDDIDIQNQNKNKKKKNKRKNKKKREKENETQHHYFNSDSLDAHYEKKPREIIPKTFDENTRLTKSELVDIVKQHFLSTPLLKDLNEIDVVKQFLLFIQDRRKKLKREFCFQ